MLAMSGLSQALGVEPSQAGSLIQQQHGTSNFFQGGSNSLFPIERHITCDFPGGLCFISLLYLDLYVLRDDALIS